MPETAAIDMKAYTKRYFLAGIALLLMPILAIIFHSYRIESGTTIRLPVVIEKSGPNPLFTEYTLTTPLNIISTKMVAGHNRFKDGKSIYVFLSPGPMNIWYPYAMASTPPQNGCQIQACLILSGHVRAVDNDNIHIRYQYEDFIPSKILQQKLDQSSTENAELILSVGQNGRAIVRTVVLDGQDTPQRKMPIPELLGLTQSGASMAPIR